MQKRHRIFIAINLPGDIRKALAKYQNTWSELPAKWVIENNLHITLVFLGYVTDIELGEVCLTVKNIIEKHKAFDIHLDKVGYGPDDKLSFDSAQDKPPKMLWASGEKSKELSLIKNDLQEALLEKVHFIPEKRAFSPHITLARINTSLWRMIEPEERPEVGENIDLAFTIESIEVMSSHHARSRFEGESELKKGGPQYTVIESFNLQ